MSSNSPVLILQILGQIGHNDAHPITGARDEANSLHHATWLIGHRDNHLIGSRQDIVCPARPNQKAAVVAGASF